MRCIFEQNQGVSPLHPTLLDLLKHLALCLEQNQQHSCNSYKTMFHVVTRCWWCNNIPPCSFSITHNLSSSCNLTDSVVTGHTCLASLNKQAAQNTLHTVSFFDMPCHENTKWVVWWCSTVQLPEVKLRYHTAENKINFHTTSQLCNVLKTKQEALVCLLLKEKKGAPNVFHHIGLSNYTANLCQQTWDALANPMALLLWMPLDSNHLLFHAPRLHKLSKTSIKQSALILSVAVWLSASCYIPAGHPLVFYFVFHTKSRDSVRNHNPATASLCAEKMMILVIYIIIVIIKIIQLVQGNVILLKSFCNGLLISTIIFKDSWAATKLFSPDLPLRSMLFLLL